MPYFPEPYAKIVLNGYSVGLPEWFVKSFEPYSEIEQRYQAMYKHGISSYFGSRKPSFEEWEGANKFIRNTIDEEKNPLITKLYVETIDKFENQGWPDQFSFARDISIYWCYWAFSAHSKYNSKMSISDKLADSIVNHSSIYIGGGHITIEEFNRLGIIRTSNHAKVLAPQLFKDLFGSSSDEHPRGINLLCQWFHKKMINPSNYMDLLHCFFCRKYIRYQSNWDKERRILLSSFQGFPNEYSIFSQIFNDEIRRFNIQEFDDYKNGENDPRDFVGYPFIDGSRMTPVRFFFSWKLK